MTLLADSSSWLITPDVGLTIWTLVVFAISLFILIKAVFPRIGAALDQRKHAIEESIDAAERTRVEADQLLTEYRDRLREARREQMLEQTRREIEAESRRVLDEILRDVAELTVLATERVTRRLLTEEDQRRLVEDALSGLDFTVLSGGANRQP